MSKRPRNLHSTITDKQLRTLFPNYTNPNVVPIRRSLISPFEPFQADVNRLAAKQSAAASLAASRASRRASIIESYKSLGTMAATAAEHCISKARVQQILSRHAPELIHSPGYVRRWRFTNKMKPGPV